MNSDSSIIAVEGEYRELKDCRINTALTQSYRVNNVKVQEETFDGTDEAHIERTEMTY